MSLYTPPWLHTKEFIFLLHRADNHLKSIIYKIVPGLYHFENQRKHAFYEERNKRIIAHGGCVGIRSNISRQKVASHDNGVAAETQIDLRERGGNNNNNNNTAENNNDVKTNNIAGLCNTNAAAAATNGNNSSSEERIDDDVEFYSVDDPIR